MSSLVWPARSVVTGAAVASPGLIEPDVWKTLTFCVPPCCAACGIGFDLDPGPDQLCGVCRSFRPAFDKARSALVYDDISRRIVMALKHGGRRDGLAVMAAWMNAAGRREDILDQCDALVPVPLHYRRFVKRGFNQSVWLAAALERISGIPLHRRVLIRTRATPNQGGKSARFRRLNVKGAFDVARPERIADRHLVLIDDVMTTGSTINACAVALKDAGARRVDALTVARVQRASHLQ